MAALLPHLSRGRLALAINALLALAALGLAFAAPGEGAPRLRLAAAGGTLSLSNSKAGTAVFQVAGMRPGAEASGTVVIGNTGTVGGTLRLAPTAAIDLPGPAGGRLSDRLELRVVDITGTPVTVYEGTLKAMPEVVLDRLEPGTQRTYRFAAWVRPAGSADNVLQGAGLTTGFTWSATGAATATPTATPSATPAATPGATPAATPTTTPTATPGGGAATVPPGAPPGAAGPLDPTGSVLGAQVFSLPAARKCVSRRSFVIRVRRPAGMVFTSLRVDVNGRKKLRLSGLKARKVKARVSLKGLPKGKIMVVVVATTTTGLKATTKRTYRTCALKRAR